MDLKELDDVVLTRDVPPARRGMPGVVMQSPRGGSVIVEVFGAPEMTLGVLVIPVDAVALVRTTADASPPSPASAA